MEIWPIIPTECPKCHNSYNLSRVPFELPCRHSFCELCLCDYYFHHHQIKCYQDSKVFDNELKDLKIPHFYSVLVKRVSDPNQKELYCSSHSQEKHEQIKYFCEKDSKLLCNYCLPEHVDHHNTTTNYTQKDFLHDMNQIEKKLHEKQLVLTHLKNKFEDLQSQPSIKSFELQEFLSRFRKFTGFPSLNSNDQEKRSTLVPPSCNLNQIDLIDSKILPHSPNKEFILSLFGGGVFPQAKLLFRASRDGFSSARFHSFCNNKGPTVTLIRTSKGYFLGAYTSISWTGGKGKYERADESFIFSLNNQTKHEIFQKNEFAIYQNDKEGPVFGGGPDLSIQSGCNEKKNSFSNLGYTFMGPGIYGSEESKSYLAGSHYFRVVDYEVFSVAF